ncbi:FHA domain-containing protein [Tuwongella immobilis]|uniref:FHA domain-containing protein n=1 Tax=Tuwongella immobilis TaxID=692036 RepID=A0A6C2YUS1_9BACT|nr:FHA domain-containing protein [Tuwongella immobilis]VIP04612.1 abc transporter atpase : ABC-type multidrug transport system, ATPase component OS=Methylomicrobium album BG8 GN=Metal_3267 PE=4 SV=1: FHA: FHA: ABC_tran: ABC2_membrane [Tuwongella immobilis]VTS06585.1 abc transporter atpase : ABC-type multidrug transport system, ATPase component OS=Methylomicrobium album BG8 GN=Metal_3267 PE=4 SV=1: FHA: FHA: ABC_tran: ABC2_membrane [Tuwongella immobilis]
MSQFPALMDDVTKTRYTLTAGQPFLVGRTEESQLKVTDVACSRRQFVLQCESNQWHLVPLSTTSPTFVNGVQIEGKTLLAHQAVIQAGTCRFIFLVRADAAAQAGTIPEMPTQIPLAADPKPKTPLPPSAAPPSRIDRTIIADSEEAAELIAEALPQSIPLSGNMLIGREDDKVQIKLQHPHVSRLHAQLVMSGGNAILTDLRSANGTFVQGKRITEPTRLRVGERIEIGPFTLVFTGTALVPQSRENNIQLTGRKICRQVIDRKDGRLRVLLDDISLVIRPHEFVCLLGPSGSGKSTLLSALSARVPADSGQVLLNTKDLYADFDSLKRDMVVVPQKDALYESLTVDQALWYTAKLRLPPDTSDDEVKRYIDEKLTIMKMTEHRATKIRDLSGGQLKRASLASELLSGPTLVFLDEVTSGLDEQTDREMMDLFRSLADAGKTVVCITHSLANVERTCHLVVILTKGGRLAFIGKPEEALRYFGIARLGDVYEELEKQSAEHWQKRYLTSEYYQRYVESRLPADPQSAVTANPPIPTSLQDQFNGVTRQVKVLLHRQFTMLKADHRSWLAMLGQSILVSLLLILVFGDLSDLKTGPERTQRITAMLLLTHISCLWFGCNNASKEIVKESIIYRREHDFNLQPTAYFLSKWILLSTLTMIQSFLLWILVANYCQPDISILGAMVTLGLVSIAGVSAGLAISAFAKTEDLAVTMVPIFLIPQIFLAGRIAPLEGFIEGVSKIFATSFWSDRALTSLMKSSDLSMGKIEETSTSVAWLVLVLHALVFSSIAWFYLRSRANREVQFGKALVEWFQRQRQAYRKTGATANPSASGTSGKTPRS